jgi:hypothetical protein
MTYLAAVTMYLLAARTDPTPGSITIRTFLITCQITPEGSSEPQPQLPERRRRWSRRLFRR